MRIQEQIQNGLKQAMLDKNEELKSFLRLLIGEFNRIDKEVSDEQALKLFRTLKENAVMLGNQFEIDFLNQYLPQMLEEDEIRQIVSWIILDLSLTSIKEMGKVMGVLKTHSKSALIDNAIASRVTKELLS